MKFLWFFNLLFNFNIRMICFFGFWKRVLKMTLCSVPETVICGSVICISANCNTVTVSGACGAARETHWERVSHALKSMWNTTVGIKNCKQLFSLRVAFTTQEKATRAAEMMSVERVAIFWVVNVSSGENSCLQFSIPTGSGAGGEGGVSHSFKATLYIS